MTTVAHSYPLSLPASPAPRSSTWRLARSVGRTASPWTFEEEVQENQGARWEAHLDYPPMSRAQAAAWMALSIKLHGGYGTVYVGDRDLASPRGTIAGTVQVDGGAQTGNRVDLKGGTAGMTALAGDLIQIGDHFYMVATDATFAGDGNSPETIVAAVEIEPSLYASPSDGDPVTYQDCVTKMRLAPGQHAEWSADALSIYGLSLDLVGAIP